MIRIILGAITGFIFWLVLLKLTDSIGAAISPDWFGKYLTDLSTSINNKTPFTPDSILLMFFVVRSAILSVVSGFVTAIVAKENLKSTLLLGILLFVLGAFVSSIIGNYVPLWYHLLILLPLIPLTILGGELRKVGEI